MKKYFVKYLYVALFILILFTACNLGTHSPVNNGENEKEVTSETSVIISGRILSVNNNRPVQSALISIHGKSVVSDSDGLYSIKISDLKDQEQISVQCEGYVSTQKSVTSRTSGTVIIDFALLAIGNTVNIDPDAENNIITTQEGASISFPQMTGITEDLTVSVTSIDVSTDMILAAPGDFSAIDSENNEVNIISRGMIDVEITGADSGTDYSLEGQGTFTIDIPISGDPSEAEETIPLWYFDTDTGKWIEEGSANKIGNVYRGTVKHFTTWNADLKISERTCISGTIFDPSPAENESYYITIKFPGFIRSFTEKQTSFSIINLPRNQHMSVTVKKMSSGEVWSKDIVTSNSDNCLNIGEFPGADYFSEVYSLAVINADSSILVTWIDPPRNDFEGVTISYQKPGSPMASTLNVAAGVQTANITGIAQDGYYIITIQANYLGGNQSNGLSKQINFSNYIGLSIELDFSNSSSTLDSDPNPDQRVYIRVNGNTNGFYYTQPVTFISGTVLNIEVRLEDLFALTNSYFYYSWRKDNNYFQMPTDLVLDDEDLDLVLGYYQGS